MAQAGEMEGLCMLMSQRLIERGLIGIFVGEVKNLRDLKIRQVAGFQKCGRKLALGHKLLQFCLKASGQTCC